LPFLNGFVGEFLIMLGAWTSAAVQHAWIVTMLAGTGVIWAAVYMLWMLQRVVFGTTTSEVNAKLSDLNWREAALVLPLLFLMFFMGVYPAPFLNRSRDAIEAARERIVGPQTAPAEMARK
jgi:NADH-quinone oxidoreductase subunit M